MRPWLEELLAHASDGPDAPAITATGAAPATLSRADLVALAERVCASLDELGVAEGEPVALLCADSVRFLACLLALAGRGALAVPIEPSATRAELSSRLAVAEPSLVVGTADALEHAAPALAARRTLRGALVLDDEVVSGLELPCTSLSERRAALRVPRDEALISCHFTYKGLGYPLGVLHRSSDFTHAIRALATTFDVGPQQRHLSLLPVRPIYGLLIAGLGPLVCGSELILAQEATPRALLGLLARERVNFAAVVPLLARLLLRSARRRKGELPALCADLSFSSGGALLSRDLSEEFEAVLERPIYQGYGSTEALTISTNTGAQQRHGSLGAPLPGVEVELRDAFNEVCPPGVAGEVHVRGPQVTPGYRGRPRETARFLRDGWLRTGDLARFDADGYLHFVGRREAFTKVNAQMVDLLEVEEAFGAHQAVSRAAASTRTNERGEDELRVAVTLSGQAQVRLGELLSLARERLSPHKVPKRIKVYRAVYEGYEAEF